MSKAETKTRHARETQIGKKISDNLKKSESFYTEPGQSDAGREIFYFRLAGDYLKGKLYGTSKIGYRYYSNKTYLLEVTEGRQEGEDFVVAAGAQRIEEIVGYRNLRRIIEQNELMHSTVRIILAGKVGTRGGHYQYVWEVFKETHSLAGQEKQTATPIKKRKKKKGVEHARK